MPLKFITAIIFASFLVACSESDEATSADVSSAVSESTSAAGDVIEESTAHASSIVEESKEVVSEYADDAKEAAQGYIDEATTEKVDALKDDLMDQVSDNADADDIEEQAGSAVEALNGLR